MRMKKLSLILIGSLCITQHFYAQETLPFVESFDNPSSMERFTVTDANKDGKTWTYDNQLKLARYDRSEVNPGDDWLFTPSFHMEEGKEYKVSFTTQGKYMSMYEKIAVTVGKDIEPENHTQVLDTIVVMWNSEFRQTELNFTVTETSSYHIGFHEISDPYTYYLFLDDIRIEEISNEPAPATVDEVTIKPGKLGALYADISFNTPSININGDHLTSLDAIEIYRNDKGNPIKTFDNPEKASHYEFRDEVTVPGEYVYAIIARNKGGQSETVNIATYIGHDIPAPVNKLEISVTDGNPLLSWQAPQKGIHNGYIDKESLTYTIIRNDGSCVSNGSSQLEFTDKNISFEETQQVLSRYEVYAVNGQVEGIRDTTAFVIAGTPYTAPVTESFMMAMTDTYPWYSEKTGTNLEKYWIAMTYGYSPQTYAYDNDAGLLIFRSVVAPEGETERFLSPVFDISDLLHPTISFYMFHTDDASDQDKLQIEASDNGAEWIEAGEPFTLGTESADGWQRHTVSLADFTGCERLQFALKGISAQGHNIHIDCVSLYDDCYDMRLVSITTDEWTEPGRTFTVSATVENCGAKDVDTYSIELLRNGEQVQVQEDLPALATGESAIHTFECEEKLDQAGELVIYSARVVCYNDEKPANDMSNEMTIKVEKPVLPTVKGLEATTENLNVHLAWTPAEDYNNYPTITDDMESYSPFIIDNIGEWTTVDMDGEKTGLSTNTGLYDHLEEPMAFQVFNPTEAGINMEVYEKTWGAYSGNQYLLGMYNQNKQTPNNDWLISTTVQGGSEISFYAKSVTIGYELATIEILYSTTSDTPEDFKLLDSKTTSDEWTCYKYRLPEETRFFAIHHTTLGGLGLMLDNISYKPTSGTPVNETVIGYNIYRDGNLLTTTPVKETKYDDTVTTEAEYEYRVTAVYPSGESYYSEPINVTVKKSVDTLYYTDNSITGGKGMIKITLAQSGQLSIHTTDGKTIINRLQQPGHDTFVLPAGIYIVRINEHVQKIAVH